MRLVWAANGQRLYGSVKARHRHGEKTLIKVRWDDGRLGTFVEGQEPDELRVAPANYNEATS